MQTASNTKGKAKGGGSNVPASASGLPLSQTAQTGGQGPRLSPRSHTRADLPPTPALPVELANTLNNLKQRINDCKPNEADFNTLERLLQDLHGAEHGIETAMHEHAGQPLVAGLCEAFFHFVGRLDRALQGKAKKELESQRQPLRDKLPLCCLNPKRLEVLCLALSTLVSSRSRLPFPEAKLGQAGVALSSINAKLMRQLLAWGGAPALATGAMLNIHNLVRREVTAGMLNAKDEEQDETRQFCRQVFATIAALAEKTHAFDKAQELGKCASQIEMLYDYDLHGLDKSKLAQALETVLAWLAGEESVARTLRDTGLVAFCSVLNLVKRFLEQGLLDADDRQHDPMWERLVNGIAGLDATDLAKKDIRSPTACANLLRTMLKAGLPQAWRRAQVKCQAKEQAKDQADLAGKFAKAMAVVLSAMAALGSGKMRDLQNAGNLLSLIEAAERQLREDAAVLGSTVSRTSLKCAAEVLVQVLPQERLARLRNMQTLTNLFNALGTLWHAGLLADPAVKCLLNLLDALAATHGWDDAHADSCLQSLVWLRKANLVSMDDLQAVLNRLCGKKSGGWSEEDLLKRLHQPRAHKTGPVMQLQPAPADADGQPRPHSPRLVGETALKPESPRAPSAGETWRASDQLLQASLPEEFQVATRTARLRPAEADAIFPIMVKGEDDEVTTTTTTKVNINVTSTAVTTTSVTTTTTTTATTSTTAVKPAPTPGATHAKPIDEWWRLLREHGDPHKKLPKLALDHPEFLDMVDEQGHGLLWHLIAGGKPLSLSALMEKLNWKPGLSAELEQQLRNGFTSMDYVPDAMRALEVLLPTLEQAQQQRLRIELAAILPADAFDLQVALARAIADGKPEMLAAVLKKDVDVGMRAPVIEHLLASCVTRGYAQVLKLLLARPSFLARLGALNQQRESILHIALRALFRRMQEGVPQSELAPRHEIAALLIEHESVRKAACEKDVHGNDALLLAVYHGFVDELKLLLKHPEPCAVLAQCTISKLKYPLLHWLAISAEKEGTRVLDVLVEHKAEVRHMHRLEYNGKIALEWALDRGKLDTARSLLKDSRVYRDMDWRKRDAVVERAARAGLWAIIPDLLAVPTIAREAGKLGPVTLNPPAHMHALYRAVAARQADAVRVLLAVPSVREAIFFACVDSVQTQKFVGVLGMSALGKAVEVGDVGILDMFLALESVVARLRQDRKQLETLLELARSEGHPAIEARLRGI